ncbi:sulfur carrier protein ThiS [Kocuria flava]|uniref:sulfur carrier protein ThiS n=1 Tax=Kocuria flava TaxID=446860 RepID=UPI003F1C8360
MTVIRLNGRPHETEGEPTVADLVAEAVGRPLGPDGAPLDGGRLGVAVALDAAVVPRSRWATTTVGEGRSVEIVTAVQGG